jgi:hypothetical protein
MDGSHHAGTPRVEAMYAGRAHAAHMRFYLRTLVRVLSRWCTHVMSRDIVSTCHRSADRTT